MLLYSQPLVSKGHWVQDPLWIPESWILKSLVYNSMVQSALGIHQFSIQRYGGPTVIMVINTLTGNPWSVELARVCGQWLGWAVEWILMLAPYPLQIWAPQSQTACVAPRGLLACCYLFYLENIGTHPTAATSGQQLVTLQISVYARRELVLLSQMSQNSLSQPQHITCTHSTWMWYLT